MSGMIQSALALLVLITVSVPVQMALADDAAITEKQRRLIDEHSER